MIFDYFCQRCNGNNGQPVILAGGVNTTLCQTCRNEWDTYSLDTMAYAALCLHTARKDAAIAAGRIKRAQREMHDHLEAMRSMHDVAVKWMVKDKKVQP